MPEICSRTLFFFSFPSRTAMSIEYSSPLSVVKSRVESLALAFFAVKENLSRAS